MPMSSPMMTTMFGLCPDAGCGCWACADVPTPAADNADAASNELPVSSNSRRFSPPAGSAVPSLEPRARASVMACLMWSGVGRKGSPPSNWWTLRPCARSSITLLRICTMSEKPTCSSRDASLNEDVLEVVNW